MQQDVTTGGPEVLSVGWPGSWLLRAEVANVMPTIMPPQIFTR
ncbi:hypothetical protein [Amycolatopsis sp. NPDC051372]